MRTIAACILSLVLITSCSYLPGEATPAVGIAEVSWSEDEDFIYLSTELPSSNPGNILLFYPGGLIDPHAYIDFLKVLLPLHNEIVIAKVDANLAVLESQKFKELAELASTFDPLVGPSQENNIIIGGHSLGGSMACALAKEIPEIVKGIILFGSYPAESADLSTWEGRVLSLTGSNDEVLNREKYNANKAFLPAGIEIGALTEMPDVIEKASSIFHEIDGGNHSGFGNYGEQNGDGARQITYEEQRLESMQYISSFYKGSGWF